MRKTEILFIAFVSLMIFSCSSNNTVMIVYETTGAISEYNLHYLDKNGELTDTVIQPQSKADIWDYRFLGKEGDIVYVSGKYNEAKSGLQIMIKVDGKIYKQTSNEGDTLNYLTISGVVPYK